MLACMSFEHVLALTDGTPEAQRAVGAASALALEHRARLTVAAVVELERATHHCGIYTAVWNDVLRDAARADLDRALRIVQLEADCEIFYGKPVAAVAEGARALGCDVIVLPGEHPRFGRLRRRHRDRAPALARRAGCTVIESE
jgi:nucleotide-binding universal stress UspA family protein